MAIKNLDWNKINTPMPVRQIDKGEVRNTPLDKAYGNAKSIVAPRLNSQPIPTTGTFGTGNE